MLILLAAGRALGGGYVSYTLAVCTSVATVVLSLNPGHYSLIVLIAMLSEICFNYQDEYFKAMEMIKQMSEERRVG